MILLTGRTRDKDRDGRERWVGREQLYICACEESVASVFGCHCSKNPQRFLLNMRVCPLPRTIHDGTVLSNHVSETCRVGLVASPPCAGPKKKERCFPMQPVPTALAESASLGSQNLSVL